MIPPESSQYKIPKDAELAGWLAGWLELTRLVMPDTATACSTRSRFKPPG